ncbi:hypothetical protein [uncultured Aquimonas sp.]|uniref:hypothetical protein n=1 Tax=uncultured Aquimonas sp. TaxID=385483 RepID=UPI002608360F|nr:hypothetical protein [uncultured Aquimonas sp.]
MQGNAGEGLGSGGSGDSGYTQILSGQNNVKVNGLPVGRHDSLAPINCDASGCGGALGQLHTGLKPVFFIGQLNRELSTCMHAHVLAQTSPIPNRALLEPVRKQHRRAIHIDHHEHIGLPIGVVRHDVGRG